MTSCDLEVLAAVWVDRWLAYGGGLIVDESCDHVGISMSIYEANRWRSRQREVWQRHWHDGWTVGRWRELQELLPLIPGLRGAVIDHVARHGEPRPGGGFCMTKPHPWDGLMAAELEAVAETAE